MPTRATTSCGAFWADRVQLGPGALPPYVRGRDRARGRARNLPCACERSGVCTDAWRSAVVVVASRIVRRLRNQEKAVAVGTVPHPPTETALPSREQPIDRALAELTRRAEADRLEREGRQAVARSRAALHKTLLPLINYEGPDDPREFEATYARLVLDAALGVSIYTGRKTLRSVPPPSEPGLRVAHELFKHALAGWEVQRLASRVREVLAPIVRARSIEGRNALRSYYQWLWERLVQIEPASPKGASRGDRLGPDPDAFRAGYQALLQMGPEERLGVDRIVKLYGLDGLGAARFSKSPRYVENAGKTARPWRLPHASSRWARGPARGTPHFRAARWWTPEEVMAAMKAQAERIGIDLRDGPGAF